MNDIEFSKHVTKYRIENNLTDENITIIAPNYQNITTANIRAYWLANLLHMGKSYAIHQYLFNKQPTLNEWLADKNSSYLVVPRTDFPSNIRNITIVTELNEGNMMFLRKKL